MVNDMQVLMKAISKASRDGELRYSPQVRLEKLIELLNAVDDKSKLIKFSSGHYPESTCSYRGYYSELAIVFSEDNKEITVESFLKLLRESVNKEFIGWKGGEFVMNEETPIWAVDYEGNCGDMIIGIEDGDETITILTQEPKN